MQVPLLNLSGEKIGNAELRDDIFAIEPNTSVMHQALIRQLANARHGTSDTKTRAEVAGGGSKPWRQKGTGRARQGSTRAPHFRHGGVVFGPTPRGHDKKMPRQMRRLALRSALSVKARDGQVRVVENWKLESPKTKEMKAILGRLAIDSSVLIVLPKSDPMVEKSSGNIRTVKTLNANYLNVRDLIGYDYVVLPLDAIQVIEGYLGK